MLPVPPRGVLRPVLLGLFMPILVISCGEKHSRDERFEIPDGYKGEVRIVYGQKGKASIPVENGRLVFRIPRTGTLETSDLEPSYDWHKAEYIFVPSGRVIPSRGLVNLPIPPPPDDLVVLSDGLGDRATLDEKTGKMIPGPLVFHFTIGSKQADEIRTREAEKRWLESNLAYQHALQRAQKDARVLELIGAPVSGGGPAPGTVSMGGGPEGEADISIVISGPKGSATLHLVGKVHAGVWSYKTLRVHQQWWKPSLDLLKPP